MAGQEVELVAARGDAAGLEQLAEQNSAWSSERIGSMIPGSFRLLAPYMRQHPPTTNSTDSTDVHPSLSPSNVLTAIVAVVLVRTGAFPDSRYVIYETGQRACRRQDQN